MFILLYGFDMFDLLGQNLSPNHLPPLLLVMQWGSHAGPCELPFLFVGHRDAVVGAVQRITKVKRSTVTHQHFHGPQIFSAGLRPMILLQPMTLIPPMVVLFLETLDPDADHRRQPHRQAPERRKAGKSNSVLLSLRLRHTRDGV